jgi:hypothetical protein
MFAQIPEAFSYQAVLRDSDGAVIVNKSVVIQFSILQGSIDNSPVYTESHNTTTNSFGLINIEIGTGSTSDDFTAIDWSHGLFFIEVSIDNQMFGTSQILSVPFAFYSSKAGNVFSGSFIELTDKPEYIDTLAGNLIGDIKYWTGAEWSILEAGEEGDILRIVGGIPAWTSSQYGLAQLRTDSIYSISDQSAYVAATVISEGGSAVTERGVVYSENSIPDVNDLKKENGYSAGSYITELTGLLQNHKYYVRSYATNDAGTAYGEELSFQTLISPPIIVDQPESISVIIGNPVSFSIEATGLNLGYQWYKNNAIIVGATGSTYSITSTTIEDDKSTYYCIVTNDAGYISSEVATLTILPALPVREVSGFISDNTIWTSDTIWRIVGNIIIETGTTLTIYPGTKIEFATSPLLSNGYNIIVNGTLSAIGTETDNISFDLEEGGNQSWGTIAFDDLSTDWDEGSQQGCVLEYCKISGGGNNQGGGTQYSDALVRCIDASPKISNCDFYNSDNDAIQSSRSSLLLTSNTFRDRVILVGGEDQEISENFFNSCMLYLAAAKNFQVENNTFNIGTGRQYEGMLRIDSDSEGIVNYNTFSEGAFGVVLINVNLFSDLTYNNFLFEPGQIAILLYNTIVGIDAGNSYWNSTNEMTIQNLIYDYNDDVTLGVVNYLPFSSTMVEY